MILQAVRSEVSTILSFVDWLSLAEVIVSTVGGDEEDRTYVVMLEDSGKAACGGLERREDIRRFLY